MFRANRWLSRAAMIVMSGAFLALAGCGGNVRSEAAAEAVTGQQFDATVQAYKGDQFELGGAVLSAIDLGSHFAYLKDQGKLPKTVLLEASDSSKIRKKHRQYMARLSIDYGFNVYYVDGGHLARIDPVAKNARDLQDKAKPVYSQDMIEGKSAAHGTMDDIEREKRRRAQQY